MNIYAEVSCEMQEVRRTLPKAARGGLGSGYFGPIHFSFLTTSCLNNVHSMNDLKDFAIRNLFMFPVLTW